MTPDYPETYFTKDAIMYGVRSKKETNSSVFGFAHMSSCLYVPDVRADNAHEVMTYQSSSLLAMFVIGIKTRITI